MESVGWVLVPMFVAVMIGVIAVIIYLIVSGKGNLEKQLAKLEKEAEQDRLRDLELQRKLEERPSETYISYPSYPIYPIYGRRWPRRWKH